MIQFHDLANLFPLLEGAAYDELVADVRENGLLQPIILLDGLVLDGRNRARACEQLGVEPTSIEFHGADPLRHVISANLVRRHLRESQRALVAARIATLGRGRPQARSRRSSVTQSEAAQILSVSERSVRKAVVLLADGASSVVAKVDAGELSLHAASTLAMRLSKVEQSSMVANAPQGLVAVAHQLRPSRSPTRSDYAGIWRQLDHVCDALAEGDLSAAAMGARQLLRVIEGAAEKRSGTR